MSSKNNQGRYNEPCKICQNPVDQFLAPYGEVYFASEERIAQYSEKNHGLYCPGCCANICVSCLREENKDSDLTDPVAIRLVMEVNAPGSQAGIFAKYFITRCPLCSDKMVETEEKGLKKAYKEVVDLYSSAALLEEGRRAAISGNYEEAITALTRALEIKPDAAIYFVLGLVYSRQDLSEKALENLGQALNLGLDAKNVPQAHKFRGEAQFKLGNIPEALEEFSQVLLHTPDDSATLYNRALCNKKMGQWYQAKEELDRVLKLNPNYDSAWFQLGEIYSHLKEPARAVESYSQALALNPEYTEAYLKRGLERITLGETQLAIQDLDEVLSRRPSYAEGYYLRGIYYSELKESELALQDYGRALKLDPEFYRAFNARGEVHYDNDRYEQAIVDFTHAIGLKSDEAGYFLNRANAYLMLDRCAESIKDYDQGLALKPHNPKSYYYGRGLSYMKLEQWHSGIEDLDEAVTLEPFASGYFNKGLAYFNLKLFKKAVDDLTQALTLDSQDATCWYLRGRAYENLGLKEQAVSDYRQFIEIAGPYQAEKIQVAKNKILELG